MKLSRRTFLKSASVLSLGASVGCVPVSRRKRPEFVNDVHTQLNPTYVRNVQYVDSLEAVRETIKRAHDSGRSVSVAGGRHAAGGQQFSTDDELIDTRDLRRVLDFDREAGTIEFEAGIQWPEVLAFLQQTQQNQASAWTIAQKQTGTDRLSIGGALASNVHGRGLRLPPIISNVDSFVLVDAEGDLHRCSRTENVDLFRLVIGGYGLFGFVYSVKLRLVPRVKVERVVAMMNAEELPEAFAGRIRDGFIYGDFQFAIDANSDDFLRRGILSCYVPVPAGTPATENGRRLSAEDWKSLIHLAHVAPGDAFEKYANHYLATSGQVYWSDKQYVSDYFDDYHSELDVRLDVKEPATEVIGELYVPREALPEFLSEAREYLRTSGVTVIYGTIRLIEKDTESYLPWAKESYACVIFNLHTPHTLEGKARTADAFLCLIDMAISLNGSYYLTYHRYATRKQLEAYYPQFQEFLKLKLNYDPEECFASDWYRHYKRAFA